MTMTPARSGLAYSSTLACSAWRGSCRERQVPEFMTEVVSTYVEVHSPVLRRESEDAALWISSTSGRRMTTKNLGVLISRITRERIGLDVSPHLFRTAGASTEALYGWRPSTPRQRASRSS